MFDTLIHDLKAATEGSRELDCLIMVHPALPIFADIAKTAQVATLLEPRAFGITEYDDAPELARYLPETNADYFGVPDFTTSLDAALTLVPEGWVWTVMIDYELPGRARLYNAVPGNINDPPVRVQADGATPALALCIAALKRGVVCP